MSETSVNIALASPSRRGFYCFSKKIAYAQILPTHFGQNVVF